jgi:hypothetical protein
MKENTMTKFVVRYTIQDEIYENEIGAASSGSAMRWVLANWPAATNIQIVG